MAVVLLFIYRRAQSSANYFHCLRERDTDERQRLSNQRTGGSPTPGGLTENGSNADSAEGIAKPENWSQAADPGSRIGRIPQARPCNMTKRVLPADGDG